MTHGTYAAYTKAACRCELCTAANRNYQRGRNERRKYRNGKEYAGGMIRSFRSPIPLPIQQSESAPAKYGRIMAVNDTYSGVQVRCKCGASGLANPKLVGKARKIDRCRECA